MYECYISRLLYLIPFKMYSKKKNRGCPFYRQHGTASTSLEQKVQKVEIASLRCMLMPRWRISGYRFSAALNKDVIACSSVSLEDGRNIPKQRDISSVETYDKKQVFDLFFERGILCLKPESALTSGKRRSLVLFLVTCVWNKFMLRAVVVIFESTDDLTHMSWTGPLAVSF